MGWAEELVGVGRGRDGGTALAGAAGVGRGMGRGGPQEKGCEEMNIILAAGGHGGNMIPAHALAAELTARKIGVALITDERGAEAAPGGWL